MSNYGNPPNDTIFVSGLPEDTTDDQLSEYFGQIGVIKFDRKNNCPKIWIYKDKATGKGKGEATITYDDPPTATSAISWFDGKEFRGSTLKIELAQRKTTFVPRGGGGGYGGGGRDRGGDFRHGDNRNSDRGGFNRGGGGGGRPGDWDCTNCDNKNFAYRQECNRCKTPKPPGAGGGAGAGAGVGGGGYRGGGGGGGRNSYGQHHHGHDGNSSRHGNNSYHRRPHDGGGGRDRDRDRDRDYGSGGGGGGGGGPSRDSRNNSNHRRSQPY